MDGISYDNLKVEIEILKADITRLRVSAIVNAANNSLMGGGGVDGAIHRAAGPELWQYCLALRGCATGQAKITPGFKLPAKYIIHTVGPVWNHGSNEEEDLLASCYENSLKLAVEYGIPTIAFPCISTGIYGFPFDRAAEIALQTIHAFLKSNSGIEKVFLVVYSESDFEKYARIFKQFI
jgi:O-acetyl-ADP-ribose deacetylase